MHFPQIWKILEEWILIFNLETQSLQLGYTRHIKITSKEMKLWSNSQLIDASVFTITDNELLSFLTQNCCCWCHHYYCWWLEWQWDHLTFQWWLPFFFNLHMMFGKLEVDTQQLGWVHLYPSHLVQEQQLKIWQYSPVMVTPLKRSLLMVASPTLSLRVAEGWKNLNLTEQLLQCPYFLFPTFMGKFLDWRRNCECFLTKKTKRKVINFFGTNSAHSNNSVIKKSYVQCKRYFFNNHNTKITQNDFKDFINKLYNINNTCCYPAYALSIIMNFISLIEAFYHSFLPNITEAELHLLRPNLACWWNVCFHNAFHVLECYT